MKAGLRTLLEVTEVNGDQVSVRAPAVGDELFTLYAAEFEDAHAREGRWFYARVEVDENETVTGFNSFQAMDKNHAHKWPGLGT